MAKKELWQAKQDTDGSWEVGYVSTGGLPVIVGWSLTKDTAHLVAAAPDTLQALRRLLTLYVDLAESGDAGFWDVDNVKEVMEARAAIAKATGALPVRTGAEG